MSHSPKQLPPCDHDECGPGPCRGSLPASAGSRIEHHLAWLDSVRSSWGDEIRAEIRRLESEKREACVLLAEMVEKAGCGLGSVDVFVKARRFITENASAVPFLPLLTA